MSCSSGWSLSDQTINWINNNIQKGSTILELGSGDGTKRLLENYKVLSIEQNISFVGLHKKAEYIHAPLVDGWYDAKIIHKFLKDKKYDCILIDGPANGRRIGFFENINLFDTNKLIMFDDTDRPADWECAKEVSKKLNRLITNPFRGFSVIL